jgi:hypothetical protein
MRWSSNLTTQKVKGGDPLRRFANFLAVNLANAVHSGAVRAVATDDGSDFYPIRLRAESLRPGAIYADPFGHILMVVRRVAQPPPDANGIAPRGGLLLAVDGQPDGTVARRRFWRGNFLFSADPALGGPGFKRFRPVVLEEGVPRALRNAEIEANPAYADYSPEQSSLGVEGFYDRMDEVLSPSPIDPRRALEELVDALDEQVQRRVTSVQNGVDYATAHPGAIDMPTLAALFETEGPWEDFSTPSRDMRLLIAIDVVRGFAARAARHPGRFTRGASATAAEVEKELTALTRKLTAARRFSYRVGRRRRAARSFAPAADGRRVSSAPAWRAIVRGSPSASARHAERERLVRSAMANSAMASWCKSARRLELQQDRPAQTRTSECLFRNASFHM